MLKEALNDAGEIMQNILNQPLCIVGTKEEMTLLQAAERLPSQTPMTSDLRKILLCMLQFPEPTRTMLRELELVLEEIQEEI